MSNSARFPSGVPGHDLGEKEVALPPGEPPPLDINAKLKTIGKPTPRIDGRAKVTGTAKYACDVKLAGMLHARVVRSTLPHARILNVDTSAAEELPGVRAVHVLERLRESARLRDPSQELPSAYPIVRYEGQPIAAVAAVTAAAAEEAARLVLVEYEPTPFVVDIEDARKADAPLVFPGPADQAGTAGGGGGPQGVPQTGNVRGPMKQGSFGPPKGDVEKGLKEADVVVDAEFRTQVQTHSALEPHGAVADWRPDGLTMWISTQGTASVRDECAEVFQLPKARVRVITEYMGGGFGAKFGAGNYGVLAAHLSRKAQAPVRLFHDRREEHLAGGNRPSSVQRLRIGAKGDGTLTAIHLVSYGTGGVGTGAGASGPAQNLYPAKNLLTEDSDVFTNAGPAAAFRAPGHPQGCFALEQAIDELAERLKMDPLALRERIDVDGDKMLDARIRRLERTVGAERAGWIRRRPAGSDPGVVKRGIGVAQGLWYRIVNLESAVEVRVWKDGTVEVFAGVQDIGGGIRTALAQVVAEELGIGAADVIVRIGDTQWPQGPGSGGSMTTGSITPPARTAAWRLRKRLEEIAPGKPFREAAKELKSEQIVERAERVEDYGGFEVSGRGPVKLGIGCMGGVQFAEVAVDTETGVITVERIVAVHDCGRPINPLAVESQVNGGVLQGISYALFEERILDRPTGRMLNANLEQYKILGAKDTPRIEVVLLEEYHGRSATDAGGIGEPATIPTAAAIANAVYNATGARVRELPMTPARVRAAIAAGRKK